MKLEEVFAHMAELCAAWAVSVAPSLSPFLSPFSPAVLIQGTEFQFSHLDDTHYQQAARGSFFFFSL